MTTRILTWTTDDKGSVLLRRNGSEAIPVAYVRRNGSGFMASLADGDRLRAIGHYRNLSAAIFAATEFEWERLRAAPGALK